MPTGIEAPLKYSPTQSLLHWPIVQTSVKTLMDSELSGEEKRRLALAQLRMAGVETATWLLSAAVEVAYGEIKSQVESDD